MMRSDSLATKSVSRSSRARCVEDKAPARNEGAILARHKISSAIQFPMPANPSCMRTTALIGARP